MQALQSHRKAGGGKAVVFSQFTGMLNLVEAALKCVLAIGSSVFGHDSDWWHLTSHGTAAFAAIMCAAICSQHNCNNPSLSRMQPQQREQNTRTLWTSDPCCVIAVFAIDSLRVARAGRRSAGFGYVRLDGSTNAKKRQENIKAFGSAAPGVLLWAAPPDDPVRLRSAIIWVGLHKRPLRLHERISQCI